MTDEHGEDVPSNMWGVKLDINNLNDTWHLGEKGMYKNGVLMNTKIKFTPADLLHDAANTYKERNEVYGDNYKRFGSVMSLLLADGVSLSSATAGDHEALWNRIGILVQIVSKLTRYCENFNKGGHDDSLKDLSVYAAMLRELDQEMNDIPF